MGQNFKQELYELFINNESARNEVRNASSPNDAYTIVSNYITGISLNEFLCLMKEIYSTYEQYQQALLTEVDLDNIAADDGDTITTLTTTTTVTLSASASVAAAI